MPTTTSLKAGGVAALVATLALGSVFATAAQLRHNEAKISHELPVNETLFEAPSPTSPALIKHGRELFLDSCAHCHAADATGDEGPDLHDVQVSDRYIANIVSHGIPHEMPAFAKKLGAPEITALTAYVRSLPPD